jgi:thiol-disulfide isomerase/thioredoxin
MSDSDNSPDLEGKTLVVNFWATWCLPCRKEMPDLQRLSDTMDEHRFKVIGVSVDEDKNLMREFLLQQKIRFDNYHDVDRHLARDLLKVRAYPETFIISPQGIIIRRIVGAQSWNTKAVYSLLESVHKGEGLVKSGWLSG